MNQRKLGRTKFSVSELCLGTMNFGWTIDRNTAFSIMDAYRAAGGSFFQSVCVWPDLAILPETMQAPEKWVGEWIQSRGIPRSELVLASRMTLRATPNGGSAAFANAIRRCCEDSLRRIGTRYLDILVCEWQVPPQPIDDALHAFDILIEAGFIRHVAAANFPLWRAMEAIGRAAARNRCRFEALQMEYSQALPEEARSEMMDLCREYNLGFLATSTLAGGNSEEPLPESNAEEGAPPVISAEARRLAWVLSNPLVSSAVISVTSPQQLTDLVQGAALPLAENDGPQPSSEANSAPNSFSRAPTVGAHPIHP